MHQNLPHTAPLTPDFPIDICKLQKEALRVNSYFLKYKQNDNPYDLDPSEVLPLVSPSGDPQYLDSRATDCPFQSTPTLSSMPTFKKLLQAFPSPLYSTRLIRLKAGQKLSVHQDNFRNFQHGILRLHVPIFTHESVKMVFCNTEYHWPAGQLWFGNFSLPHGVINQSDHDRVHLVIDMGITHRLLSFFPQSFYDQIDFNTTTLMPPPHSIHQENRTHSDFFCRFFYLPPGFLNYRLEGPACTIIRDNEYLLSLNNQYFYRLNAITENTFILDTMGPGRQIKLKPNSIELVIKGAVTDFCSENEYIHDINFNIPTQ